MFKRAFILTLAAAALALSPLARSAEAPGLDWPQWRGAHRDGVWRETGLIDKFDAPQIPIKWRMPVGGGYSGPTVANGQVYVMDRVADKQQERVHCWDWKDGHELWTHVYLAAYGGVGYPDGPRASVTIDEGRAYSLGAIGNLYCLDALSGRVVWSHDCGNEYKIRMPIWGVAPSPLIEGGLVIVHIGGENNACVVAFDKMTGVERWRALPDESSYSSPIIIDQAGKRVLVVWTGQRVVGLNPQNGNLYWEHPFPHKNMVISIATPVVERDRLLVTNFYDGALMLRLKQDTPAVEKIWRRVGANERATDALQGILSTPVMIGDYVYGVDSYGELRCLDAKTGDRIWEDLTAVPKARWANIHFVKNGDKVWMFNERGELIIARLTPQKFEEISRANLIEPTRGQLGERGGVCWSHPAFAYQHVFARNDNEIVCASLKAK